MELRTNPKSPALPLQHVSSCSLRSSGVFFLLVKGISCQRSGTIPGWITLGVYTVIEGGFPEQSEVTAIKSWGHKPALLRPPSSWPGVALSLLCDQAVTQAVELLPGSVWLASGQHNAAIRTPHRCFYIVLLTWQAMWENCALGCRYPPV